MLICHVLQFLDKIVILGVPFVLSNIIVQCSICCRVTLSVFWTYLGLRISIGTVLSNSVSTMPTNISSIISTSIYSSLNRYRYENSRMQYKDIFSAEKRENVSGKFFDIFNMFAQNIDCGYMLEPPHEAVLTSTHNLCFGPKIRKIGIPQHTPSLTIQKCGLRGYPLHGHVFLMTQIFSHIK